MEFLGKPETELASNAGKVNFEWIIGVEGTENNFVIVVRASLPV